MADAYARVSGKPAIVTAQNGPAATLLVAPLAEAMKVSVPVIALVQDVNRDQTDRNAFQELDHIALFQPVTKWVRRVTEASRIEDYVDQAFAAACSGRPGPVALLLPADLLAAAAPAPALPRNNSLGHFPLDRSVAAPQAIARAASLLAQAQRPVVVAGGGCTSPTPAPPWRRCRKPPTCRSPPRSWARARSTSATRCRSAWSAATWAPTAPRASSAA